MKKERYTAILEFEVIKPTNDMEQVGEILSLSSFGEYCPENSLRGYSLLFLLDQPKYYRVCKIVQKGINYTIPIDRKQNWVVDEVQESLKYKI
jgi:hypothetical protein